MQSLWAVHIQAFYQNLWAAECDTWETLCLLRRAAQEGDRKGFDHQICPPRRGKTPRSLKTLPHLQSFMTAWDELVQDVEADSRR